MSKARGIIGKQVGMSDTLKVTFTGEKQVRHECVGLAIKLSNLIKKKGEADQLSTVEGSDEVFTSDWTQYVEGRFK